MSNNLFGTDGIRARVGEAPFDIENLAQLGKAIAQWALENYGPSPIMVVGHDTRASHSFVKAALQSGLLVYPITIHDTNILSTPALCYMTQKLSLFDFGIMISASHNPYHDNGIKIIKRQGKLTKHDEQRITELFFQQLPEPDYATFGTVRSVENAQTSYLEYLLSFFKPNFLTAKKIVLDCAHGATYNVAPSVFRHLGAELIIINNDPNGININEKCGAVELHMLQQQVIHHQADVGFAFDGDGDRVMAVNALGDIKDGDDILSLLLQHPAYSHSKGVVGTVITNHGFSTHLAKRNINLIRAAVGDKNVIELLHKENLPIGGEPSGHTILRDFLDTGDGIFTALRLLETIDHTNNNLMNSFEKYPQVVINLPVTVKKDLESPQLAMIIAMGQEQLNAGRLVVRYSGTENFLRIMVEAEDFEDAQRLGILLSQAFHKELSIV